MIKSELLLFVLLISGFVFFAVPKANTMTPLGTIYIRADGSVDPPTPLIQRNGDIYTLTGNINSSADGIVIERNNTILDGAGYRLQGLGPLNIVGINVTQKSGVTIRNANIESFSYGVLLYHSSNTNVTGNYLANNSICGISLRNSSICNAVSDNDITNNLWGIQLLYSSGNILRSNVLYGNEYNFEVSGIGLSDFVNDVDASNTVDGKPIYYLINVHDITVPVDAGCVVLVNSTRVTVQNLDLTRNMQGVLLAYTTNTTITRNKMNNSKYGVWLYSSSYNIASGNNITSNDYSGIQLSNSSYNTVSGSKITATNWNGIVLAYSSCNNTISGNSIVANYQFGIVLHSSSCSNTVCGNNIRDNTYSGITFWDGSYNTVSGNDIANNNQGGIDLGSSYTTVSGNNITDNNNGITLTHGWNNSISGNNITDNHYYGISLHYSSNSRILGNNITANNAYGIGTEDSSNSSIIGNNIKNNGAGIQPYNSPNCIMSGNNIANNEDGIRLYSSNCNISGNNITANQNGIYSYGYRVNIHIHHNNFVDNGRQVSLWNFTADWDDGFPSGGNYWSDYRTRYPDASEIDDSGIWDTPYEIDANNTDHYPLMNVIPEFPTILILPLFMSSTLLATVFYKRKHKTD